MDEKICVFHFSVFFIPEKGIITNDGFEQSIVFMARICGFIASGFLSVEECVPLLYDLSPENYIQFIGGQK